MGNNGFIGSLALNRNRCQHGGLEPASVLVGALKINVGGPFKVGTVFADGKMARARVKPHIHDVFFFGKAMIISTVGALKAGGQKVLCGALKPGVCALFAENFGHLEHCSFVDDFLAALIAVENRDRHAPFSLTGDAPIVAVSDHRLKTVVTPFGDPFDRIHRLDSVLAEVGNRAEPLACGTEKHRLFAAPAMGILVDYLFHGEKCTGFVKINCDGLIGLVGGKSGKFLACLFG